MANCRRTLDGPMLPTHRHDCDDAGCDGCQPCPEHHCTARERCTAHVAPTELSCGECIGKTRRDIAQIVELAALMLGEAIERGVNSEAANLAGPAADPAGWEATQSERRAALNTITDEDDYEAALKTLLAEDDPRHPLTCLGWWEMAVREDYGPESHQRITVASAAAYLDRMLHRLANDPAQDFALFAGEVATCRAHMEAVLHDSRQPERGAPCPNCPQPAPRLGKHYDDEDTTGASDRWTCPACGSWWSEADYRLRVGARYVEHADRLTADQIETTYRVPAGTLRRWVSEGKVDRRGKDGSGRQLYDVAQVKAMREAAL